MTRLRTDTPAGPHPDSVRGLLALSDPDLTRHLNELVPPQLLAHFSLAEARSWVREGRGPYRIAEAPGVGTLRLQVWPLPGCPDPALDLELVDTYLGHLEASWIVLNDVSGPRFDVDRDPRGALLPLGAQARNLGEEIRALKAGLAPNQVRPGLGAFRELIRRVETLAVTLGRELLYVSPLAYHNAVQYERYGFTYASGQDEVAWIQQEFQPGGALRRRMDGSRPFRMPWMADTVRGRSWAIRDGVLGRRWTAHKMYKIPGHDFATVTCPDLPW